MKHFIKWMLGISVVLLVVGIGMTIAGVTLGARFSEAGFLNEMGTSVLHIRDFSDLESFIKGEKEVETFSELFEEEKITEEEYEEYEGHLKKEKTTAILGNTYNLTSVKNLEIDLNAGELEMRAYGGEDIQIKVDHEDKDSVKVSSGKDFLKIEATKKVHHGDLKIYYPKDLKLEQLKIEVAAGTILMKDKISSDYLTISIGAGELEAKDKLYVRNASIEVGAGEADIAWISTETLEGHCGVGEMSLGLEGSEKDYNYYLECGLGEIQIGENKHSSIADSEEIENPGSSRKIALSCGMGEIEIFFKK